MAIKLRARDVHELHQALDYGLECLHADIENMEEYEDAGIVFEMRLMLKMWSELQELLAKKLKKKGRWMDAIQ